MSIHIPKSLVEQINRHGEQDYPHECCGFMYGHVSGEERHITELRMQSNEREDSRENRFLISPDEFMQAERYARKTGLDMLGVYHSHPDHPAIPSEFDREHAWPWYTYLIVNVGKGKAGVLKGWQLREDRSGYDELELTIEEESNIQS